MNDKNLIKNSRVIILQKLYSHQLNKDTQLIFPKHRYKKFIKDVVLGTIERKDLIDELKTIDRVRKYDFNIGANYIFGLPDEDHSSMRNTLNLAKEINSEWANFYSAMAYPGSQLHVTAKSNNFKLPEDEGGPGWIRD